MQHAQELREEGKFEETEVVYRRALTAVESIFGPNHINASTILIQIASCYEEQGRQPDAFELYRRVHAMVTGVNSMIN